MRLHGIDRGRPLFDTTDKAKMKKPLEKPLRSTDTDETADDTIRGAALDCGRFLVNVKNAWITVSRTVAAGRYRLTSRKIVRNFKNIFLSKLYPRVYSSRGGGGKETVPSHEAKLKMFYF